MADRKRISKEKEKTYIKRQTDWDKDKEKENTNEQLYKKWVCLGKVRQKETERDTIDHIDNGTITILLINRPSLKGGHFEKVWYQVISAELEQV